MRRRGFITLLGGAAAAWPLAARAQQPDRVRRVGILMSASESDKDAQLGIAVFRETLDRLGWSEGRNLRIESRWGDADPARINALAKELVKLSPDMLVAYTTPAVKALQQETRSIPIVFLSVTDPVGQGLVVSLAHPGGNITGFAVFEFSLGAKFLEILKQISPNVARVTTIFNPETAPYYPLYLRSIEQGASSFAVESIAVEIHNDADIERTLSALARDSDAGLIVLPDSFNIVHRARIIELVNSHRLPAIYFFQYFCQGRRPGRLWP
jgi:putative ABC transport system substrate-binding protein